MAKSSYQRLKARLQKEMEITRQLRSDLRTVVNSPESYRPIEIKARVSLKADLDNAIFYGECCLKNHID